MRKVIWIMASLILGLAAPAQAANDSANVTIATGSVRGVYFRYGSAVAELLAQKAGIKPITGKTEGSLENLVLVQRRTDASTNTFYYGASQLDAASLAYSGQSERFKTRPAKELRLLWAMYPDMLHLVAAHGSGINSVSDLKGKQVSTGGYDSGTSVAALAVLTAAGLKPSDLGAQRHFGMEMSIKSLSRGTLDAFFAAGGLPLPGIADMMAELAGKGIPASLVTLGPESQTVKNLMATLPGVYQSGVIAKSVYHTKADCQALAIWNLMVCHQDVPEEQAYKVTKTVFENLATLQKSVPAAKDTTPANSARLEGGSIPFHPGALRYFKEIGAIK